MRNVVFLAIVFSIAILGLGSCGKTGPAGPQGEQGPVGPKGNQGSQGVPGVDGSTIYSGDQAPLADLGENGDYYLNKSNGDLYGPKTEDRWDDPVSLKGKQGDRGPKGEKGDIGSQGDKGQKGDKGQDGKDGSQILSGSSIPSSQTGELGDYYLSKSTSTLYGPKMTSGWGVGVPLRGLKGEKGDKGDPGTVQIKYTEWQEFNWGFYGMLKASQIIHEPKITEDFMSKGGMVLVYVRVNVPPFGHSYFLLPSKFSVLSGCYMEPFIRAAKSDLIIELFPPEGGQLTSDFKGSKYAFRYLLIPGGTPLRYASRLPDPADYEAICTYYGIAE